MTYDIGRPTGRCFVSDRRFEPGEEFIAVMLEGATGWVRRDYALENWSELPNGAVGFWRCAMPNLNGDSPELTTKPVSTEQILQWFDAVNAQLPRDDHQQRLLYVTALLLVRRKALKLLDVERSNEGEYLVLKRPRGNGIVKVRDPGIADDRLAELERELTQHLLTAALLQPLPESETPA